MALIFFSTQFIQIISHYKKSGYNIDVLQQNVCFVVNPITVGNFAFLFNCTLVGRTSRGCLQFVIVVFPDHTHLLFFRLYDGSDLKVSNGAKIRNRYNQVPHLTQDTNGKVTNSQKTPQTRAKRSALFKDLSNDEMVGA